MGKSFCDLSKSLGGRSEQTDSLLYVWLCGFLAWHGGWRLSFVERTTAVTGKGVYTSGEQLSLNSNFYFPNKMDCS